MGATAFHPAEYIDDEMKERGWTIDDVVSRMSGDRDMNFASLSLYLSIRDMPNLRLGELAIGLEEAFGVNRQTFWNLEKSWVEYAKQRN